MCLKRNNLEAIQANQIEKVRSHKASSSRTRIETHGQVIQINPGIVIKQVPVEQGLKRRDDMLEVLLRERVIKQVPVEQGLKH